MDVHKTLKPVLAILRERSVRLIAYIDDLLIMVESRELILDHVTGVQYLLESLRFIANTKKSVLNPAQVIEFLGLSMPWKSGFLPPKSNKFEWKLTS